MAKRRGEYQRAADIWKEMVADSQDEVHACEQLAIYYEHRAKDFERAMEYTKLGLGKLKRKHAVSLRALRGPYLETRMEREEKNFRKRLARLERKAPLSSPSRRRGVPEAAEPRAKPGLW